MNTTDTLRAARHMLDSLDNQPIEKLEKTNFLVFVMNDAGKNKNRIRVHAHLNAPGAVELLRELRTGDGPVSQLVKQLTPVMD